MNERKRLTCGVLLYELNPLRVFLVRESGIYLKPYTGEPGNWGIPKGGLKKGKTAFATALCEFEEETGIALDPAAAFEDLGPQPYNQHKNLHAWALRWLPPAETRFACTTGKRCFDPKTGQTRFIHEVIDWRIFSGEEALEVINHRQAFLVTGLLARELSPEARSSGPNP
jgi:8-oxo-dGTP pyrophosphatase MutT (NUDIX family)